MVITPLYSVGNDLESQNKETCYPCRDFLSRHGYSTLILNTARGASFHIFRYLSLIVSLHKMQGRLNKYPPDGDYEAFNCIRLAVTSSPTENWMLCERHSTIGGTHVSVLERALGV
jgi:hypothetical protein